MFVALRHACFLAIQNLRHEPLRAVLVASALALTAALPIATAIASAALEDSLLARSDATPILVGAPGNDYDLALSSLYFTNRPSARISYSVISEIEREDPGRVVPLYLAHSAQGVPIVATSQDYFLARELSIQKGRGALQLGELVAGAEVARRFGFEIGDQLRNDLSNLYNISGAYPFLLRITGILDPVGSADDRALFTNLTTAWTLDGRMHGHAALAPEETLGQEDGTLEASAATFLFAELNAANRQTFHLHGEERDAPISAALVFPKTQQSHDLLLGKLALRDDLQTVRPSKVVAAVLSIVLSLRRLLDFYFLAVATATALLAGLIAALTARLRRSDLRLMRDLGASRGRIAAIVATELFLIATVASGLCAGLIIMALGSLLRLLPG